MRRGAVVVALSVLAAGCQGEAPEPPPVADLLPQGARPTAVRRGNIDGDVTDELVVASVSRPAGQGAGFPVPSLQIFDARDGDWRSVFDARGPAPPGPPGTPDRLLRDAGGFVAQSVEVVELVDFERDGSAELAVAVASAGATSGPVELWIVGGDHGLRTEFYEGTARGGEVTVEGDRIRFAFPVYRPDDPGCCPGRLETQSIGFDRATGRIGILHRARRKL